MSTPINALRHLLRERQGVIRLLEEEWLQLLREVFEHHRLAVEEMLLDFVPAGGFLGQEPAVLPGGNFNPNLELQVRAELFAVVREMLDEAGYGHWVTEFGNDLTAQLDNLLEEFRRRGLDVGMAELNTNQLEALVLLEQDRLRAFGDSYAHEVEQQLRSGLLRGWTPGQMSVALQAQGVPHQHAGTLANTSLLNFYQQANNLVAERTEAVGFVYLGPDDAVTRPFCGALVEKWLTQAEIARLDNQQMPDVFTTRGGFNCRHSWLPIYEGEQEQFEKGSVATANLSAGK